jgi:hypothetical protein
MDQNKNDLIDTDTDKDKSDVKQEDQQKYQQILDEYSQQLDSTEKSKDLTQHEIPPQNGGQIKPTNNSSHPTSVPDTDLVTSSQDTNTPDLPIVSVPQTHQEIKKTLSKPIETPKKKTTDDDNMPQIEQESQPLSKPTKKKFDLFKYLFYISVIIFLVLVGLLAKDYLTLQNLDKLSPSLIQSPSPTASSPQNETTSLSDCVLNEISYQIGDTVPSQDKCNTCVCQQTESGPQIVCTEAECQEAVPASSSAQDSDQSQL